MSEKKITIYQANFYPLSLRVKVAGEKYYHFISNLRVPNVALNTSSYAVIFNPNMLLCHVWHGYIQGQWSYSFWRFDDGEVVNY